MCYYYDIRMYMYLCGCRDDPVHMVYRTPRIHLNGHGQVESRTYTVETKDVVHYY